MTNILLVDDDEIIIETYKAILEIEGYTVHTALNSYKAIQIIQNLDIQLAILDYNLPNMTGTQLGHLVKKAQESTEIMFISGNPKIHELVKEVNYSVCKVFSKPLDLGQLVNTVKSIMSLNGEPYTPSISTSVEKLNPIRISRLVENITQTFPNISIQTII